MSKQLVFRWFDKEAAECGEPAMIQSDSLPSEYHVVFSNDGEIELLAEGMDCDVTGLRYEKVECDPMQYTGLKDKNGKGIYEGDLLVCKDYPFYGDAVGETPTYNELNYVAEVYYWEDEAAYYAGLHVVSDRVSGRACGGCLSEYAERCEIIGNIHENSDLLPENEHQQ